MKPAGEEGMLPNINENRAERHKKKGNKEWRI